MLHHVCGWIVLGCKCSPLWMEQRALICPGPNKGPISLSRGEPTPAPCLSFPALCQTRSWETLNGSFQAFVFWQLCFCFLCPSLSPSLSGYSVGSAPVFTLRSSAVLPLLPTPRSPVPER